LRFSEALLDKLMHAAALPQFISDNILGNFFQIRKIFCALLEKSTSAHGSSVIDIPGNFNAGPTTFILRGDKESIILFF
jgi:hypothetical protein